MENVNLSKKTATKRKPKSQGITKGTTSKKERRKRYKICRSIASSTSDTPKTKSEFIEIYREMLRQAKIENIPSDQTLIKDINKCKIDFKYGSARISSGGGLFSSLGYDINYYIRQLRLVYDFGDIILIDTYSKPRLYPRCKKDFVTPLEHLINDKANEESTSSQYTDISDKIIDKTKKMPQNAIFHLHFILDKKGFEYLIEDAFCKDCETPPYFLYIETHSYCTTIVFEYSSLNKILDKTFEIIEYYPF